MTRQRIAFGSLCAGVLCVVGGATYLVVAGDTAATIFFSYLIGACGFVALLLYRMWHRDVLSLDNIEREQRANRGFFARIWSSIGDAFTTMQYALAWPATLFLLIRALMPIFKDLANRKILLREHMAAAVEFTEGAQFYGSLSIACMTVVWFAVVNTGRVHSIYAVGLLYVFAAAVMVRHVASFWIPAGLAAGFKQAEGSPMVKFATVLVCDVTTLVLAFSSIRAHRLALLVQGDGLARTTKELWSLGETVPKMLEGGPAAVVQQVVSLPRTERIVLVAGFLLYTVLIKTAKEGLKPFIREDGDYLAMAQALIAKGKYEKALEQVGKVKDGSTKTEELRLTPLLARGNVEKAKQCARRMLEMNPAFSDDVTKDDVYWELLTRASMLPPDLRLVVWRAALADAVSGSLLLLVLTSWTDEPTLLDTIFSAPAHPSQAIPFAHFLLGLERPADAIQCLGETTPDEAEDRVSYLSLFLIAAMKLQPDDGARRTVLAQWMETERESYEQACRKLFDGSYWRQFLAVVMLSLTVNETAGYARAESLWFDGLRGTAEGRLKSTEQGRTAWRLFRDGGGATARFGDLPSGLGQVVEEAGQKAAGLEAAAS